MRLPKKVYAIRHNVTNRVYIGSTCHVDKRFNEHISALRSHRHPVEDMQADFDRYGEDFSLTVLDHIATEADRDKEYDWMKKNQSYIRGIGYNYNDRKWLSVDKEAEEPIVKCEDDKPSCLPQTENEEELVRMIRNHEDPVQAMIIAACLIVRFWAGTGKAIPAYYVGNDFKEQCYEERINCYVSHR